MSEILPAGTYRAHAGERVLGVTSKNSPQVAVECIIDQPGFEGRSITYYGYFTDAALQYAVANLRAMGWVGDNLADLSTIGKVPFNIVVEHEEYDGKVRAKVVFINAGGVAVANVMNADETNRFAASMRSKIAALATTVRTPKAIPGKADHRSATAGDVPDNIPF